MNTGVSKFLQGHVIAHNNVLVSYSLLKPFLGKIFILKKVHRNSPGRLRPGGYNKFGWNDSSRDR